MSTSSPWYKDGLRFSCTGCGKCCCGSPGYVWVTVEEIAKIATYLHLDQNIFMRRYVRKVEQRYSLIELKKSNFACPFLKDQRCFIYPVRPLQCKTFPWWEQNLSSEAAWEATKNLCEGIHDNATIHSLDEIKKNLCKTSS